MVNSGPAYSTAPWSGKGGGPHCSQKGEFCFLCTFSPGEEGSSDDYWSDICDTVTTLVQEGKEIVTIVDVIFSAYEANIRPNISYIDDNTGLEIKSPLWSKVAIGRHLQHASSQWPELFDHVCENILVSLIVRQNDRVVDLDTEEVIDEKRKALIETINAYRQYKTSVVQRAGCGKTPRSRR